MPKLFDKNIGSEMVVFSTVIGGGGDSAVKNETSFAYG